MLDGKEKEEEFCIVYNLSIAEGLELVLPHANICSIDKEGRPSYQKAIALPDNMESYGLPYTDSVHKVLIDICVELTVSTLEKTFNKTRKKHLSLTALFSEQQTQKSIQAIIDKRMVKFLEIIHANRLFLSFNLQRKIKASDVLLSFSDVIAKPLLHFAKTQTGIKYQLNLETENKIIKPSKHTIQFIANDPAIILIDNVVTSVDRINAYKLKPFLKNESVFIPDKLAKQYFEQFILDVLGKVDVEVEGFELLKITEISGKSVRFIFDLFKDKWFFEVNFLYDRFVFSHVSPSKRKNHIEFDDQGNVKVYQCLRNIQDESAFIKEIQAFGFRKDESLRFTAGDKKFDVFHFFGSHLSSLKGICDIEMPEIDEKKSLYLLPGYLQIFR